MKKQELTIKGLTVTEAQEDEARETLESLRWKEGAICPRCGSKDIVRVAPNAEKKIRKGLYRCKECR
ncbi:MAG: transposase, partial [Ignavibacteriaceae bacterium]